MTVYRIATLVPSDSMWVLHEMAQKWKQSAVLSKHSELEVCLYSIQYVGNIKLLAIKSHRSVCFSCGSKEFKRSSDQPLILWDAMTPKLVQIFYRKIPPICSFPKMKNCDQNKKETRTLLIFIFKVNQIVKLLSASHWETVSNKASSFLAILQCPQLASVIAGFYKI